MWLSRISGIIDRGVRWLLFPMLLLMFIVVTIAVILRLVNISFISSYDISRLFFIWMTFFGMTVIYKKKGHMKFSFIYDTFNGRSKRVVDAVIDIFILVFFAVMIVVSVRFFPKIKIQNLPGSGLSAVWLYLPFFIAPAIMVIHAVAFLYENVFGSDDEGATA